MAQAEFAISEESLQFFSSAHDIPPSVIDPNERPELTLARQRMNLTRNMAINRRPRSKMVDPDIHKRPEVVYARLMHLTVQAESLLETVSASLETLDSRRAKLFSRRVSLQEAIMSAKLIPNICSPEQNTSDPRDYRGNSMDSRGKADGVLCPFFLTGECMDPACPFYHPD